MEHFLSGGIPIVYDILGVIGFGLYVLNYTLLTMEKVSSKQIRYFAMNWCAASLVLIGLMNSFNLAAALLQIFWVVFSTAAILIRLRHRRRSHASTGLHIQ